MHHYAHNIGEFAAVTRYMSRIERDIFRDMRDMYMLNERPLDGRDPALLARRLGCVTQEELEALQFVLAEQFELVDGMWHNDWCDKKLEEFQGMGMGGGQSGPKSAEAQRKARSRARRAAIFSELAAVRIVPPATTTVAALHAICKKHGIDVQAVYARVNGGCDTSRTSHDAVTDLARVNQNQNQNQINPPNPPAGGASGGLTIAAALAASFPEHRRTRIAEVAQLVEQLVADGEVTGEQLLAAARQQRDVLAKDDGRAAPAMLSWLRRKGWLDALTLDAAGAVPADWRSKRSTVEAMGARVGMQPYEVEPGYRLLAEYRAEVERRLAEQGVLA